ncbi:MAG: PH domain-containing protein [Planctomycetota bacterium]|jgi:membrane protein YdbS with pleckstrin-like domain|nr:PH domain-containing protein [Planctomycetota bacterium]RLS71909.1 MAG: PH domain-containing protein [Planctomycetota bacterium]RLT17909.1 MAG: PH domain-containing protein [Planctomycetota bacterium]
MSQSQPNESAGDPNSLQSEFQPRVGMSQEPENRLWEGGYSAKAMYGTWLILAAVTLAVIAAMIVLPILKIMPPIETNVWWIVLGALLGTWVLGIATFLYRRLSVHYELTTQRFIHSRGILVRTVDRIDVIDIDDVSYVQGIIQRTLGVGKIQLQSKDRSHPSLLLAGIDQVERVSGMIDDVRRKERRKRSLHIDAS